MLKFFCFKICKTYNKIRRNNYLLFFIIKKYSIKMIKIIFMMEFLCKIFKTLIININNINYSKLWKIKELFAII